MTRINAGINPKFLTDEHLLAEHREIKRVCNRLSKRNGNLSGSPTEFKLGSGHELFFIKYGKFTYNRYVSIHNECLNRGFNVCNYSENWNCYNNFPDLFNDYIPKTDGVREVIKRISERIISSPKPYFHYYKGRMSKNEALLLIQRVYEVNR